MQVHRATANGYFYSLERKRGNYTPSQGNHELMVTALYRSEIRHDRVLIVRGAESQL